MNSLKNQEFYHVRLIENLAINHFDDLIADVLILSKNYEFTKYMVDPLYSNKKNIQTLFSVFIKEKPYYDQIRYINEYGMEIIRIKNSNSNPIIVSENVLQNTSQRDYFIETSRLEEYQVYISKFDLNMESNKFEYPLKPTMRISTPIYTENHEFKGILILNYKGYHFKTFMTNQISPQQLGTMMLLNKEGTFLISENDEFEYGFLLEERTNYNFEKMFPQEWSIITSNQSGQFVTENGIFTYDNLYLSQALVNYDIETEEDYFKFVSWIMNINIKLSKKPLRKVYTLISIILLIFDISISFALAYFIRQRNLSQAELKKAAMTDTLTGALNRRSFYIEVKRIAHSIAVTDKTFSLIMIDIDYFKNINDQYGHDAGDLILKNLTSVLQQGLRGNDILARWGGEEFIVLLPSTPQSGAKTVAENLRNLVENNTFHYKDQLIDLTISLGISSYSGHEDIDNLIKIADDNLYKSKQGGRNRVTG